MSGFAPRFAGVDTDHLAWMLVAVDGRIRSRMDDTDYRLFEDYMVRAQLRYGAGFAAHEVLDDLWSAGRCIRFREDLHLARVPVERFRVRRVQPLEVSILGGERRLARQVAEGFGLPIGPLAADMAPQALKDEVRYLTRYFDGRLRDEMDLAGLAAAMYVGALSALVRGFDDEAMLAVRIFRQALHTSGMDPKANPHTWRYLRLLRLVRHFTQGDEEQLVRGVGELVLEVEPTLRAGMDEEQWRKPPGAPSYLDLSPFAFVALATYREWDLPLEDLPAEIGLHRDMFETLATPIERQDEEADAEARAQMQHVIKEAKAFEAELRQRALGDDGPPEGGAPASGS